MPTYTYICDKCNQKFEIFLSFSDYNENQTCPLCQTLSHRSYIDDFMECNGFVKLADSEIKTLGHLAHRNTEKMSNDQKQELFKKHNDYKYTESTKPLPKGMSRIQKGQKTIWPK